MIEYIYGDVTKTAYPVIMHGCNAQGKMNSGVAKAIREVFPDAYTEYMYYYDKYGLNIGDNIVVDISDELSKNDKLIINAITQKYYGYDGQLYVSYDAVKDCFGKAFNLMKKFNLNDLAIPAIGCGRGGGSWQKIKSIIEETNLDNVNIHVYYLNKAEIES